MSHDTDKLIRQLSLVAFLMAERRPLTARDVKGNVEGYSEMSDEAFARRFYSDRAELIALGVPLHSQRDEFTGEELYTLRSENYFLDELELDDDELAALPDGALHARGDVRLRRAAAARAAEPRARPPGLRRCADRDGRERPGARPRLLARDGRPALEARVGDLEAADDQVQLLVAAARPGRASGRSTPTRCGATAATWYVVGHDLDNDDVRTFRVSRIRSDIRFATRRERDFRLPADFDVDAYRVGEDWQHGPVAGTAKIEVNGDTAWWVHRTLHEAGTLADGIFETEYAAIEPLAGWVLRQNGRALPLEPEELRAACAEGLQRVREAHEAEPPKLAREKTVVSLTGRPRATGAARRTRALRGPPGAARLPARGLWRGPRRRARRRRPRRALPHPARRAPGPPLAAEPRQLRRRLLHGLRRARRRHRARRQGAVRRRLPARAALDAARGARDPACARHRRPVDRGPGAHAARPRPQEARGDVRAIRGPPDAGDSVGAGRGGSSSRRSRAGSPSAASSRSST